MSYEKKIKDLLGRLVAMSPEPPPYPEETPMATSQPPRKRMHPVLVFAGAAVVDSAATTVWMAATVVLPRFLLPLRVPRYGLAGEHTGETEHSVETSGETVTATDLAGNVSVCETVPLVP